MNLGKLAQSIWGLLVRSEPTVVDGLHSAEDMHWILQRERSRTDRSGDPLAVISFELHPHSNDTGVLLIIAKALKERLRLTDEIGWMDPRKLGVILPSTGLQGAHKVAETIQLKLPEGGLPPSCTIYVYPQPSSPEEKPSERKSERQEKPLVAAISSIPVQTVAFQEQSIEVLLARPMPVSKRIIDIFGATVGLILLLPLFLIIAAAVKLSSPGPVFFRQQRSGRGGRPFFMLKFRTMVVDAEARKASLMTLNEQDGPAFKIRNDPRVTRLGRFLRKTSLDELPQLWNVLWGEMSLVGPRPLPCAESDNCTGWHRHRLDVTPGITGLWQVWGRSSVSFDDWVRMDLQYIRAQSLQQDLWLLLQTVPVVLMRKGAH